MGLSEILDRSLLVSLLFNVSLLLMTATILTEIRPLRQIFRRQERSLEQQFVLAGLFGVISVACTYAGVELQGAVVNTRVISTTLAGLLGGPVAGIGAGLISGFHRYIFNIEGFTSLACGIGTFLFGLIGALFHKRYLRLPPRAKVPFWIGVTVLGELVQCAMLFLVSRPFESVLALEQAILLPKMIVNSLGMVLFGKTFDRLNRDLTSELVEQQSIALLTAQTCLPHLRGGLTDRLGLQRAADIVRQTFPDYRVVFTDHAAALAAGGLTLQSDALPGPARRAIEQNAPVLLPDYQGDAAVGVLRKKAAIAVPFTCDSVPVGALMLLVPMGDHLSLSVDLRTAENLAQLFSTVMELDDVQRQIDLRHQAEFRALQAQINPHFFHNALNTISALCRTDPGRAREMLLVLSNYFRQTLTINEPFVTLEQELSNVENYLTLVHARFEGAIHVSMELPHDLTALRLPPLILQPLVENAVRHGGTAVDDRHVLLQISLDDTRASVRVCDRGHGFPPEILAAIEQPDCPLYSGLFNVRKRLQSIYGPLCQFQIASSPQGSTVAFSVPLQPVEQRREPVCESPSSTMKNTLAVS